MSGTIEPTPLMIEPGQFLTADGLLARQIPTGTLLFRVFLTTRGPDGAVYFGGMDPAYRLNDPGIGATHPRAPQPAKGALPDVGAFGVCYLGYSPDAAFVEVFFRRLPVRSVSWKDLSHRSIGSWTLARKLTVLCLHGVGLQRAGVDGDVVSGADYRLPQVVARTYWRHPLRFDGIEYPTRHDTGERSLALFDRAADAVPASALSGLSDLDPVGPLVRAWEARYHFEILTD